MDEIFDALPDAVLVVLHDEIVRANAAAAEMLGEPESALIGRPLERVLAGGERGRLRLLEEQRSAGWDLPTTCRVRFVRADGCEVSADVRFRELADRRRVISARDVTEVTRAEELMSSLGHLMSTGSLLEGADAVLDASAPVFLALGWTVAFTEVFSETSITHRIVAPEDDPVGQYGRTLIGRRLSFEHTPVLAEVERRGAALFLDNVPRLLSSSPVRTASALSDSMSAARVARSAWCPIRIPEGRFVLAVTGRDLTEHDFVAVQLFAALLGSAIRMSALRGELVRTERLAAVGEMAAVLAHEVRNPLAVMFNAVGMLRKEATAVQVPMLDVLAEEGQRLRVLVADLLDFATPPEPKLEPVELAPLLAGALEAAESDPSFAAKQPVIDTDFPRTLPSVVVDSGLVRRALVNLLVNAFQHVPPKGRVSLHADSVDGRVRVRIENEGEPVAPEVARRVFEPFFTTKPTGSGLGLAIVKQVAESLGGAVEVEPRTTGASFALWLRTI